MLTEIDQMSARSAQLKGEVSALQSALTELTVTQTEMDERSTQVAGAAAGLLFLAAVVAHGTSYRTEACIEEAEVFAGVSAQPNWQNPCEGS